MNQPLSDADTLFQEFIQELPKEHAQMAYEFQAFTRARKIKTPLQLLRVVFLYCGLDLSLREVAANFTLLYEEISDTAIANRLSACRPWFRALLNQMLQKQGLELLQEARRLLLTDGSTVQGPGAKGVDWRIHIAIDLFRLEFVLLEPTGVKGAESLERIDVQPGDILIADRGYSRQIPLLFVQDSKGDVSIRLNPRNVCLEDESNESFDLYKELKSLKKKNRMTFKVFLTGRKSTGRVEGWVHATRVPKEIAEKKHNQLLAKYRKKGKKKPGKETLFFCGWMLVFTTLCPIEWTSELLLKLYRLRWQVELAIKRLKSLLDLSEMRSKKDSKLGEIWLYGKLLYAVILERRARRYGTGKWDWLELSTERKGTLWRVYKMAHLQIIPLISGSIFWSKEDWEAALKALSERRRKRKLQTIPLEVVKLCELPKVLPNIQKEA